MSITFDINDSYYKWVLSISLKKKTEWCLAYYKHLQEEEEERRQEWLLEYYKILKEYKERGQEWLKIRTIRCL